MDIGQFEQSIGFTITNAFGLAYTRGLTHGLSISNLLKQVRGLNRLEPV